MEILSFDIEGKFAHFRKFHGNNTAMSYSIPPRTTIAGMLAAIMGEEKDSYYENYQTQNLQIGLRVLSDLKKSFHRLNLLMIKGNNDFRGGKGRVQTPFEVVTGSDLKKDSVRYRIYLAPGKNREIFDQISQKLKDNNRQFNLSLGIAGFTAFVSNVQEFTAFEKNCNGEWINLHSAGNSEQVEEIDFPDNPEFKFNHIEEELLPADFIGGKKGREVYRMNRVLFATRNFPIHVKLFGKYFQLKRNGNSEETENFQFLTYAGVFTQQTD
ncbi:MAG: CRISPR-associated protein Cas5 [Chitinophagales bacterium]